MRVSRTTYSKTENYLHQHIVILTALLTLLTALQKAALLLLLLHSVWLPSDSQL